MVVREVGPELERTSVQELDWGHLGIRRPEEEAEAALFEEFHDHWSERRVSGEVGVGWRGCTRTDVVRNVVRRTTLRVGVR